RPSLYEVFRRIIPLVVALIFLAVGMGVGAFAPVSEATNLCLLFCVGVCALLTTGQTSNIGPVWNSNLYVFLVWIVGPISVHFHLYFPQSTNFRGKFVLLGGLYLIGLLGGATYLLWGTLVMRSSEWFPIILTASRLFLALNTVLFVGLLFYSYRHEQSPGVKSKIRIVFLGGILSALPLLTLTLIPEALLHRPVQPYDFAILWMGILPLTYGYAIFRFHLIEIESHVNRGATLILVFSILGGIYLFLYTLLYQVIPFSFANAPLLNTILVMVLASIIVPVYRQMKRLVDTVFYGGWYDYRSAITQITQGLEKITDLRLLAETVSERLVRTLRLEDTCVFLSDIQGDFSIIDVAPHNQMGAVSPLDLPALPRSSMDFLLKVGGTERTPLAKALAQVELSPEEQQLLNSEQAHLWIPIIGQGELKGFLALGPKYGGDIFSAEDMDILRVVAQQIGAILENIHLLNQLRQHASELEARVEERTAELHDAKERVEAILASVGDGVIVVDLEGCILAVNAAMEKQSGYRGPDLVGQTLESLLANENDPQIVAEMKAALASGEVWQGELITCRKNGTKYDIHLTIAPVRDQHGNIVSFVGSQRDITHQKELDRLKDIFVADVSHELRTPTTNINLYLELLEFAPPEKHREYLQVIKEQSQLLKRLVEDILDLSRLAMNKSKKIEFTAVDLNLITDQVVTAHSPLAAASGLRLEFTPTPDIPPVRGEQSQLARVITNLVANAIHYTQKGQVSIRTFQDNDYVCLEVCDTGMGIEEEDISHIFERFYRGRHVRQTKIHGTGLGLAIVKEIVELHSGDVQVSSTHGQGSSFRVALPAYTGEEIGA
ncbi:MAG: ATP-binding protein, partial [Anaerolineales bacterium]|nr:ATP-binding protein [Anaerolineales bacterium]